MDSQTQKINKINQSHKLLNKLEILMLPVYPPIKHKKKPKSLKQDYRIRKKKQQSSPITNRCSLQLKNFSQSKRQDVKKLEKISSNNINPQRQTLNIQFEYTNGSLNSDRAFKTIQSFRPSLHNLQKRMFKQKGPQQKILKTIIDKNVEFEKNHYNHTDSQSLLRKNSLFLLNFIQTKQRQKNNLPKANEMPFLTQLHMKKAQEKNYNYYHFQKNTQKIKQQFSYESPRIRKKQEIPFVPEPW